MASSLAPRVRCMYRFVTAMSSCPMSSASTFGGCPRIATCEQNVWRSVEAVRAELHVRLLEADDLAGAEPSIAGQEDHRQDAVIERGGCGDEALVLVEVVEHGRLRPDL